MEEWAALKVTVSSREWTIVVWMENHWATNRFANNMFTPSLELSTRSERKKLGMKNLCLEFSLDSMRRNKLGFRLLRKLNSLCYICQLITELTLSNSIAIVEITRRYLAMEGEKR